jgi:hypothetical protein
MSDAAVASIEYSRFKDETQLDDIIGLISNDLSEPYSIYVYRYFIQQWYRPLLQLALNLLAFSQAGPLFLGIHPGVTSTDGLGL